MRTIIITSIISATIVAIAATFSVRRYVLAAPPQPVTAYDADVDHTGAVSLSDVLKTLAHVGQLAPLPTAVPTPTPIPTWTAKASILGLGGSDHSVGVADGKLYAVGRNVEGRVEAYDPTTDTWTTKASMPTPRYGPGVGVVDGILYAIGGHVVDAAQGTLNTVEAYDPTTDTWTTKAPMPTARQEVAVGVVDGILYAIGGRFFSGEFLFNLNTLEAYNPVTDSWTPKASMSATNGRSGLGVGVIGGILYAVGGYSPTQLVHTVEAYDPVTDSWTKRASMPMERYGLGVGVVNDILYAVGGFNPDFQEDNQYLKTVETYDPVSNGWTPSVPMLTGRFPVGVGVVSDVLYAVGGDYYGSPSMEAYAP